MTLNKTVVFVYTEEGTSISLSAVRVCVCVNTTYLSRRRSHVCTQPRTSSLTLLTATTYNLFSIFQNKHKQTNKKYIMCNGRLYSRLCVFVWGGTSKALHQTRMNILLYSHRHRRDLLLHASAPFAHTNIYISISIAFCLNSKI